MVSRSASETPRKDKGCCGAKENSEAPKAQADEKKLEKAKSGCCSG